MREIRPSGSEGGGLEFNRFSLPLSRRAASDRSPKGRTVAAATPTPRYPRDSYDDGKMAALATQPRRDRLPRAVASPLFSPSHLRVDSGP